MAAASGYKVNRAKSEHIQCCWSEHRGADEGSLFNEPHPYRRLVL